MKCPSCKGELRPTASYGIALDECARCGGVWFDAGELKKTIDSTDNALRWIDFDLFEKEEGMLAGKAGPEGDASRPYGAGGAACPHCGTAMEQFAYAESAVTIHRCGTCKGVWLAQGELSKMIDWLEDLIARKSLAQYEHDAAQQFAEIFSGPKGAVSEAKDFLAVAKLLEYRAFTEHPKVLAVLSTIENHLPFK